MRILKQLAIALTLLLSVKVVTAQNNVGIGTLSPSNSAMLDVVASDKGLLIPRVALTGINTPVNAPATGLMVYNTSTTGTYAIPGFYYFDGTNWTLIGSGGGGPAGPAGPAGPTGPAGPAGPTSIQSLSISGNNLTISGSNTVAIPTVGGGSYTAGTGISITGSTIANTAPNTIQTLTLNVSTLTLSGGGGSVVLPSGGSGGTLNDAYNFGGPGLGRAITANDGSVTINASGTGAAGIGLMVNHTGTGSAAIGALLGGSGTGNAINALNSNAANGFAVIQAETNSSTLLNSAIFGLSTGAAKGISGQVSATGTATSAIYGNSLRTTGGSGVEGNGVNGVVGFGNNVKGFGVYGKNNLAPTAVDDAVGVYGLGGIGVFGQTSSAGPYAGVFAENIATSTATVPIVDVFGLFASANGGNGILGQTLNEYGVGVAGTNFSAGLSGNVIGVYGSSNFVGVAGETTDPTGYGVYSDGNLGASGTKSFVIDHPLDPANKFLKHFSIESDEVLNVYRGTVALNADGDAVIELPVYFKEININFSYQLTAIGSSAPNLFVKDEIKGNSFKVSGGNANQKVSWTVYAERNDLYLQKYPENRNTEVEKRPADKGTYQHPEFYGLPKKVRKPIETKGAPLELTK